MRSSSDIFAISPTLKSARFWKRRRERYEFCNLAVSKDSGKFWKRQNRKKKTNSFDMDTPLISLERRLYEGKKIVPNEEFRESLKAFLFSQIGEKNETWFLQYLHPGSSVSFPEIKK